MRIQRESSPGGSGDGGEGDILYGRQSLLETLRAGRRKIRRLLLMEGTPLAGLPAEVVRLAERQGIPVAVCARRDLDRMTHSGHHQGLALEAESYAWTAFDTMLDAACSGAEPAFFLVLDHIQDPQNVGSMMRSADAAGVNGVVLPRDRACLVTPAVVRASSGAVEHLPVARVTNLARAIEDLKRRRIWVYALDGRPEAPGYTDVRLDGAVAIVVGSEGEGVSRLVRDTCDGILRIPMRGRVGSLNAGVAAALALYEVRRQRDAVRMEPES